MLDWLTYGAILVTLGFTGFYAIVTLRDPGAVIEVATHRLDLLPNVMAGRYVVVFLFTLGVLIWGTPPLIAWFFATCTFLGLYDGWVYWRRGLPHGKHTASGLLSLVALAISLAALWTSA